MANHTSGGNAAHPSHIPPSSAPSGSPHRWKVLWATFLSYFFNSFDLTVLAIVMPVMLKALALTLPEGATVEDVFELLGAQFPSIVPFLRNTPQVVINNEMAYHLHLLHDGDEVELRVPMFGG